jgi:acyl carrier protein
VKNLEEIIQWIRAELAQAFDRPIDKIDPTKSFARLGVDSTLVTHLVIGLEDALKIELDPDLVAELLTPESLAAYAVSVKRGLEMKP